MAYYFRNVLGEFHFDNHGKLVEEEQGEEEELPDTLYHKALENFRASDFYNHNLIQTKRDIRKSTNPDVHIIQATRVIDDLNKANNLLTKRLRDWYEYHNPEFSRNCHDNESFVLNAVKRDKKELLEEIGINPENSMGTDISAEEKEAITNFGRQIAELFSERERKKRFIEEKMNDICPNILAVAGASIGAQLLNLAGGLKDLSELPASTIQLLGAEKALFRHIRSGARCPKYGIIINHPFVRQARLKGKAARSLSDKICIAAKIDYFKGDYYGDKLLKQLESKASMLK